MNEAVRLHESRSEAGRPGAPLSEARMAIHAKHEYRTDSGVCLYATSLTPPSSPTANDGSAPPQSATYASAAALARFTAPTMV